MGQQVLLKRQLVCFFRNFNFRSTPFWDTFKVASVKDRTEGERFSHSFPYLWCFAWLDENFMTRNTKWKHWWVLQGRCNISYSKGRGQVLIFPPARSIWEWQNISQLFTERLLSDVKLQRTEKKTQYTNNTCGYGLGAVGYRCLCLFSLVPSLLPVIQHSVWHIADAQIKVY